MDLSPTASLTPQLDALRDWAGKAREDGWISAEHAARPGEVTSRHGSDLFADGQRPLIVAFFGGTGVGKSSLINRLAGKPIARVGVERPTSHGVTLYLHEQYRPDLLRSELPVEKTRIITHDRSRHHLVAWLDLPDIDSTAEENRRLVERWLPCIDWLVYVVSPERYRDEAGWRYLLDRGRRHAWIFVMNHWDRGRDEQLEDFRSRLQAAGFANPHILRTSCAPAGGKDDFDQLQRLINGAIKEYGLQLLQELGIQARFDDLLAWIADCRQTMGGTERWDEVHREVETLLAAGMEKLSARLQADIRRAIPETPSDPLPTSIIRGFGKGIRQREDVAAVAVDVDDLVGTAVGSRLRNLESGVVNLIQKRHLPTQPLRRALTRQREEGEDPVAIIRTALEDEMATAMQRPGTPLRRLGVKITGMLAWVLPLAAALYVVYRTLAGYQAAIRGRAEFFGVNFVIHSLLLILLAWFIPRLVHLRLRPDPGSTARRGLMEGSVVAGRRLRRFYGRVLDTVTAECNRHEKRLAEIERDIRAVKRSALEYPENFIAPPGKE